MLLIMHKRFYVDFSEIFQGIVHCHWKSYNSDSSITNSSNIFIHENYSNSSVIIKCIVE